MNIKDAEHLTGLKKANIRYYEEMGLLTPERNEQNNYREYGEREVGILKRIKLLRMAGVPLQEIHLQDAFPACMCRDGLLRFTCLFWLYCLYASAYSGIKVQNNFKF